MCNASESVQKGARFCPVVTLIPAAGMVRYSEIRACSCNDDVVYLTLGTAIFQSEYVFGSTSTYFEVAVYVYVYVHMCIYTCAILAIASACHRPRIHAYTRIHVHVYVHD